jgi:hypothetical protein
MGRANYNVIAVQRNMGFMVSKIIASLQKPTEVTNKGGCQLHTENFKDS